MFIHLSTLAEISGAPPSFSSSLQLFNLDHEPVCQGLVRWLPPSQGLCQALGSHCPLLPGPHGWAPSRCPGGCARCWMGEYPNIWSMELSGLLPPCLHFQLLCLTEVMILGTRHARGSWSSGPWKFCALCPSRRKALACSSAAFSLCHEGAWKL